MSKTTTVTIADFLLARLAEDEAAAREAGADGMTGHRWKHAPENVYEELQRTVLASSARILREVEAKRRVVEACRPVYPVVYRESVRRLCEERGDELVPVEAFGGPVWPSESAEATLRALVSVYADHEDFDAGWAL